MIKPVQDILKRAESRAPAMAFMSIALAFGAWVTRLPEVKENLGLSEGELGTALFFIPLGAVTLLPFYSRIIQRLGERKSTLIALTSFLILIVIVGQMPSKASLMAGLYLLGLTMGLTDVAMNAVVSEVEKQESRSIMSSCHGFFSIGGMFGALLASMFIWLGGSLFIQSVVITLVLLTLVYFHQQYLLNSNNSQPSPGFQWPRKEVFILAMIGFCIMMCEGGIVDWSTIYLKESLEMSAQYAGLGFGGFSLFMALARFKGDELTTRFGLNVLIRSGMLVGVLGLALTLLGNPYLAIIGFSISGLGLSVIVPTLFSSSTRVEGVSAAKGIASVASAGYIGLLVGPVVIGFVAERFGLGNGFLFLLGLVVLALLLSIKRNS